MKPESIPKRHIYTRKTPFGPVAVVWSLHGSEPQVERIMLSKPGLPAARQVSALYPGTSKASDPVILRLADDIAAFLDGWDVKFGLDRVGMDLCSPFQQRVLRAEHGVPRGRVTTYGRLARHLGRPKAARAVGNCLATNPFPIVIPCHRAIRSDGTLGGYQGGVEMKRALLEMEAVRFDPSGRVLAEGFHY